MRTRAAGTAATGQAGAARAPALTAAPAAQLWETAAARWEALERPYPVGYARWREAEALMAARDREGAARTASSALAIARRLGSAWLADEIESLAVRARLQLGDDRPEGRPPPLTTFLTSAVRWRELKGALRG